MAAIVTTDLASIVSNSWGEPAQYSTINARLRPASSRSARWRASASCSPPATVATRARVRTPSPPADQVDYPTSSPYVTSVGGTSLAISSTQELPVGNLLGHHHRPADPPQERRQEVAVHAARQVPRRVRRFRWRWREHRVHPALLPGGRGARPAWPSRCRTARPAARPCGWSRTCRRWPTRAPGSWSARRPCSRTGRPTPSRSAGSAAPAWPAPCSPASRRTRSRRPVAHSGSPTRPSTTWTRTSPTGRPTRRTTT